MKYRIIGTILVVVIAIICYVLFSGSPAESEGEAPAEEQVAQ